MFRRLSNSWELTKASAHVLSQDKELMVFPAISALMLILVTAGFIAPMVLLADKGKDVEGPLGIAVTFVFYVVSYFVIFFCNSALVGAALIRLRGGDPTVADGFRIAGGKVGVIFAYAVVAATVGMVLRAIQQRAGLLGRIVSGLFGMAWNLATFLVVPVLVNENIGPIEAVKRSTELLKKTWGEQVVGNFGVSAVMSLIVFGLFIVFIPVIVLAAGTQQPALIAGAVGGFVLCLMALALVSATLSGIYTAALYRYASEGQMGEGFAPAMVKEAFQPK
jgi:hypothetical protein